MGSLTGTSLRPKRLNEFNPFDDKMEEKNSIIVEESVGLTPEQLGIEFGLMTGVAVLCILLFAIYIAVAKKPQNVPAEYFMKNRLPLVKKVLEVKKEVKRQKRAAEEEVFVLSIFKIRTNLISQDKDMLNNK